MEKDLILTCDAGTTGCKCSVFNFKGEALHSVRCDYSTNYPRPNWAEQDPDLILEAMYKGIRELLLQVSPQRIACVGLSGTMNGCIAVDAEGRVLRPNIIHSDSRSGAQVDRIATVIRKPDFYRLTGTRLDTHYTLPKILWLKENEPDIYRRARWFMNIKDYMYAHLTGRWGYTDYSDASLTTAMDINSKCWAGDLLGELGLSTDQMPKIIQGHNIRGKITRDVYHRTGLITGTPVAIGGGDGCCTARGAGLVAAGDAYTYIGSSAWVSQITDHPVFDPKARIFNFLDADGESCHVIGTVQTGAAAFDWAMEKFMGAKGSNEISRVENMARQVPPGAEGVLFLPTLMGSRTPYWDPNTRGVLMGFSLYHDQRHIARAIYEGVAFALNSCAEIIAECGTPIQSMMLAGGGASSGLWPDILAATFGLNSKVHQAPGECTSLGAAIIAGVGAGIFSDYAHAASMVKARSEHPVNPVLRHAYEKVYPIYHDIYEHVRPLTDRIAAIDN